MNKKKFVIATLAIIACFSMVGCGNNNSIEKNVLENTTINKTLTTFEIEDGVLKGFSDETKIESGYELKITNLMEGEKVNFVDIGAFKGNDKIVSLTIEGNIGICSDAFAECNNLNTVSILSKESYIDERSFKDCTSLEFVELFMESAFVKNRIIPLGAFENCTELKSIVIKGNVREIQQNAFKNCVNLEKIDLTGCEYIGVEAFYNCSNLKFELPENIKIDDNAFGMDDNTFVFEKSSEISIKKITNKWEKMANNLGFSKKELEIAKNEIFARYGHDFENEEVASYFAGQKWYKKIDGKKVNYDELNDIEKANVDLINEYIEIATQKEESNGSFVYLHNDYINAYIDRNFDISRGCKIIASYMYRDEKIEREIFVATQRTIDNEHVLSSIAAIDNTMLDNEVTFLLYSGDNLIAKNTLKAESASIKFDYHHEIKYKKDGTFTIDSWTDSFQLVDEDGERLKLFDLDKIESFNMDKAKLPFSEVPVFVNEILASDGCLYSYETYDNENNKITLKKACDKKIVSYDVTITVNPQSENMENKHENYKVDVLFTCEDGSILKREYLYAPMP